VTQIGKINLLSSSVNIATLAYWPDLCYVLEIFRTVTYMQRSILQATKLSVVISSDPFFERVSRLVQPSYQLHARTRLIYDCMQAAACSSIYSSYCILADLCSMKSVSGCMHAFLLSTIQPCCRVFSL